MVNNADGVTLIIMHLSTIVSGEQHCVLGPKRLVLLVNA